MDMDKLLKDVDRIREYTDTALKENDKDPAKSLTRILAVLKGERTLLTALVYDYSVIRAGSPALGATEAEAADKDAESKGKKRNGRKPNKSLSADAGAQGGKADDDVYKKRVFGFGSRQAGNLYVYEVKLLMQQGYEAYCWGNEILEALGPDVDLYENKKLKHCISRSVMLRAFAHSKARAERDIGYRMRSMSPSGSAGATSTPETPSDAPDPAATEDLSFVDLFSENGDNRPH